MARTSGTKPKRPVVAHHGAGWGGPAKGAGNGAKSALRPGGRWIDREGTEKRALERAEKRKAYLGVLDEIALDKEQQAMARIAAADKALDRIEGKAVERKLVRQITSVRDLSDEELEAMIADAGRD